MTSITSFTSNHLTLVEVLEVIGPEAEFAQAVRAAVRRLEAEGVRELVNIHFYSNPGSSEVGAVIVFSDSSRVIDHMNMITGWEEFQTLAGLIRLVDMRVFGKLSPEAEAWIRNFGTPSKRFEQALAGFVRALPHQDTK